MKNKENKTQDPLYEIPNYTVINELMLSLRQLIMELLKHSSRKQQIEYLRRVVNWFYNK